MATEPARENWFEGAFTEARGRRMLDRAAMWLCRWASEDLHSQPRRAQGYIMNVRTAMEITMLLMGDGGRALREGAPTSAVERVMRKVSGE